jgi:hypothetical protein
VHPARTKAARERRSRQHQPPPAPMPADLRRTVAAMRAWDVAEYLALRAWWAEHGHIFAGAGR